MFVTAPVLMQFDPDRETIVEADSSGYVVGGVLLQYDEYGVLRPCAYYSQRNTPTESNYEIYDKELLAIVKCLRAWDSELRSLPHFEVVTDHQNLTYFTTTRKLKERQMRWADELSRFDFTIRYRPGREGTMPDVLSRRDQDMPVEADDRYKHREAVLLQPEMMTGFGIGSLTLSRMAVAPIQTPRSPETSPDVPEPGPVQASTPIRRLWHEAKARDSYLSEVKQSILRGDRRFTPALHVGPSISECSVDEDEDVCFRNRKWVPDSEQLRTLINQEAHDSILSGHPGREGTY